MFLVNFPLTQTTEANSSLRSGCTVHHLSSFHMSSWRFHVEFWRFPMVSVTGPITSPWCIGWIRPDSPIHLSWVTVRNHSGSVMFSGCSKSLDDWQKLEIHGFWHLLAMSFWISGIFWMIQVVFWVLATHSWPHFAKDTVLSASFSYDVTLFSWIFSWRISTKKSRVLWSPVQYPVEFWWTLEGTRRENPKGTRRENPKDSRNITTLITTPFCFVRNGGHVFVKASLLIVLIHTKTCKNGSTRMNISLEGTNAGLTLSQWSQCLI